MTRVCFVCSGNICRSPTAQVVMADLIAAAGRSAEFVIDSAGTGAWHVGQEMDQRSRATLVAAGYQSGPHVARQFTVADFGCYDVILAIDAGHLYELIQLAARTDDPAGAQAKISLLRSHDPSAVAAADLDVPDPYYGGPDGFGAVLGQLERACAGLLTELTAPN